jgi:hypothetical protein
VRQDALPHDRSSRLLLVSVSTRQETATYSKHDVILTVAVAVPADVSFEVDSGRFWFEVDAGM